MIYGIWTRTITISWLNEYENKYGPLTISSDEMNSSFTWVKDKWPWEGGRS